MCLPDEYLEWYNRNKGWTVPLTALVIIILFAASICTLLWTLGVFGLHCQVNEDCPTSLPHCQDKECYECIEDRDCIFNIKCIENVCYETTTAITTTTTTATPTITTSTDGKSDDYVMIYSDSCESYGCKMLDDKDDCENAANVLMLSDRGADVGQKQGMPYGCSYADDDFLLFNPPEAPPFPPAPCGSVDQNESKYNCICRKGDNLWKEVAHDKYCKNYVKPTSPHDVHDQIECQGKCIEEIRCIGISYSYEETKTGWCYLCKDEELVHSGLGFGFYRQDETRS